MIYILDFKIGQEYPAPQNYIPSREKNKEYHQVQERHSSKQSRSKTKQHLPLHFSSQHTPSPEIKPAYHTQQSSVSFLTKHMQLVDEGISAEISWIATLLPFCLCGKKNMNIKAQKIGVFCTKPTKHTHSKALLPKFFMKLLRTYLVQKPRSGIE